MAKLFIGIAAAFMLATAAVSFLLKGKVDALQTSRKEAISRIQNAEGQAKAAKNEADKAQKEAKAIADQLDDANKQLTSAKKDADDAKKGLDECKLLNEEKDKKIAELTAAGPKPVGPDPAVLDLTTKLQDMTTQKDTATKERDEARAIVDSQAAKVKSDDEKVAQLEKRERKRIETTGLNGLQARILAVNNGWNFVVLSVGDKAGVTVNDPLLVVRGNEPVAKLRVTSVEPSTCIADVIPSSVRRGISVQPGDTVIFQGRTPATQPDNKPAPEVPAGGTVTPPPPVAPPPL